MLNSQRYSGYGTNFAPYFSCTIGAKFIVLIDAPELMNDQRPQGGIACPLQA